MEIIETPIFTRELKNNAVPDDDYRGLQIQLVANPDSGALIQGTGGARKMRKFNMEKALFEKLITSAKQARDISKGKAKPSRRFTFKPEDIAQIRKQLSLSQNSFAALLGVPASTLKNWEQGRTTPDAPAQTLLRIAHKRPEVLSDVAYGTNIVYRSASSPVGSLKASKFEIGLKRAARHKSAR